MDKEFDIMSNVDMDHRQGRREQISLLRSRVEMLEGEDREVMEMYLDRGCSITSLAKLMGMHPGSLGRRIKRITHRLTRGEYVHLRRHEGYFDDSELSIATDHFLHGKNFRRIASRRKMSYHKVRDRIGKIRYFCKKIR